MIEQHARRTKIVKSFEGKALSAPEAEKVAREEVDVLRLVWSSKVKGALLDFLKALKKYRTPERSIPVMLDVAHWTQAVVTGLKEPRAVVFGEKIIVSQKAGQGTLQLTAERWPTLFKAEHDSKTGPGAVKVFFGTGLVVMDVVKQDGDRVELEVKHGGT
ncbi:MAG: hypothetical protein IT186_22100, partial [Acidobacteria bacterium]|nr:hypothetical protein [Acidobacteriota bacterium]